MPTNSQIFDAFKKLSQSKRELVSSEYFSEYCNNIIDSYITDESVKLKAVKLITYLFLDLKSESDFISEVKAVCRLSEEKSSALYKEVKGKILDNVDNVYLLHLDNIKKEEESEGRVFDVNDYLEENEIDIVRPDSSTNQYKSNKEVSERVESLCQKYGLNENQKNQLYSIISLTMKRPQENETLSKNISETLAISEIKSDQIAEEINAKIIKLISQAPNTKETKNIIAPPENLPVKMEPARVEVSAPTYKKEEISIPSYIPNSTPNVTVPVSSEPIQRPIPVPRFNASSEEASTPSIKPFQPVKKVETLNIIEAKLNKPTSTPNETKKQEMPTTKYSVDPYREPLE